MALEPFKNEPRKFWATCDVCKGRYEINLSDSVTMNLVMQAPNSMYREAAALFYATHILLKLGWAQVDVDPVLTDLYETYSAIEIGVAGEPTHSDGVDYVISEKPLKLNSVRPGRYHVCFSCKLKAKNRAEITKEKTPAKSRREQILSDVSHRLRRIEE